MQSTCVCGDKRPKAEAAASAAPSLQKSCSEGEWDREAPSSDQHLKSSSCVDAFSSSSDFMQIECLLPKAKVTFTKFGERYCMNANYHPRAYYGSKYDGETLQIASDYQN